MKVMLRASLTMAGSCLEQPLNTSLFVVKINKAYAERLIEKIRLVSSLIADDDTLYEMRYWDASGDYFAESDGAKGVPEGSATGDPATVECCQLVVFKDEVAWTGIPKHGDYVEIVTDRFPLKALEGIAAGRFTKMGQLEGLTY